MLAMNLIKLICIGYYLIWGFLGPSQISQIKYPLNITHFTVEKKCKQEMLEGPQGKIVCSV